jgi:hypothetical protein
LRGHAVDRLVDGSQRQSLARRKRHVVISHDGDVSRYFEAGAKHAVLDTDRGEIICRTRGFVSTMTFAMAETATEVSMALLDNLPRWKRRHGCAAQLKTSFF